MKRIIRLALLALVCAIPLFTGCQPGTDNEEVAHLSHRYASAEEGRQMYMSNTGYFNSLTQNDIDWKSCSTGKTIDEFKDFSASQIQDFTEEEKKAVDAVVTTIEARFDALGIGLPETEEICFVKSNMDNEGGAAGFTFGNTIYLSSFFVDILSSLWQGKQPPYPADYNEYIYLIAPCILAHELFHCLSRKDAAFRQRFYSLIGFTVMDHEVEFGPKVRNLILANPDVERFDNWAEFTINGQKRRCTMVGVYETDYAEVAKTDPGASFFDYSKCVLVPLDDPDTMIPAEQASDFYQIVGSNSDYLIAAEECIADNFGFMIGSGFNGHHDFIGGKLQFVPYQTPELIRGIYETMLELYPD